MSGSKTRAELDWFAFFIERFRSNIGAIWPRNRPSVDEEFLEILFFLERFEDATTEFFTKVSNALLSVIEGDANPVIGQIFRVDYDRHISHFADI